MNIFIPFRQAEVITQENFVAALQKRDVEMETIVLAESANIRLQDNKLSQKQNT